MNRKKGKILIMTFAVATALGVGPIRARAGEFTERHPRRAEVNRRERRQQDRIANGVRSGRLNASETANLEGQEARLKAQERREVLQNGGYLTKGEQRQLNREENGLSREIYQDKHN